jgi:biotin carboxylase
MAHLLLLEVPGGNDFTVLEDAVASGHQVTFFTGDLSQYEAQGERAHASLSLARQVVEIRPFNYPALEHAALSVHVSLPFDALLCILDIRIVDASDLAATLGLRFLNPATTRKARDKVAVRQALAGAGVRQPRFAGAASVDELRCAAAKVGFPALVKPSDGYGSQNVFLVRNDDELSDAIAKLSLRTTDYGLGIRATDHYSVEQYIRGAMIGCDVFSNASERVFLGINDKLMFPPPSFAMRGSCFPSDRYHLGTVRDYAFQILDAIGFDFGACHIEMIVAPEGPYLVEVNPRLVSAQIPFQMGYALERSVYADLINLHLGQPIALLHDLKPRWFSAIRWFVAEQEGELDAVELPEKTDDAIRRVVLFKETGDPLRPPINNGDRIGYVIAVGATQANAEANADHYIAGGKVILKQPGCSA